MIRYYARANQSLFGDAEAVIEGVISMLQVDLMQVLHNGSVKIN